MNLLAVLLPLACLIAASLASVFGGNDEQRMIQSQFGPSYEDFIAETPHKRAQTFVRFGKRAQTFVRFGRSMPTRYADDDQ